MYWLVSDDQKGPIALVKCCQDTDTTQVIAGDHKATEGFKGAYPNTFISQSWYFEPLSKHAWWPEVGHWIDKLGPVLTPLKRLQKEREREATRQRVKSLTPDDKAKIVEMRGNGVTLKKIANKYQIGEGSIRSILEKNAA